MNILEKANSIVHGERQQDYGPPTINHTYTAEFWNTYLGEKLNTPITAEDVCFMMILQKISRAVAGRVTEDTLVDIAGYSANIEIIRNG